MATELEKVEANIARTQERINQMVHVSNEDVDGYKLDALRRLLKDLEDQRVRLSRRPRMRIQKTRVRYE